MDELPQAPLGERDLPRWVQVVAGLVLGLMAFFCGFASLVLVLTSHMPIPILGVAVCLVLLLGCLWVLAKSVRLVTGRKVKGGLMSPKALRVVSYFMIVIPIVALFTGGYYRKMGALMLFQALMYFVGFLGLHALARKREARPAAPQDKE